MKQARPHSRRRSRNTSLASARTFGRSGGFSLVEMLLALAICSALLVAVLSALVASFRAYQATTEQASTHVVGRIVMHRMMALVRNSVDFGPLPEDARDQFVLTDQFLFIDDDGREIQLRLDRGNSALLMRVDEGAEQLLLEGVRGPTDEVGAPLGAFTLEYENGTKLIRASFDLTVEADDNASLTLEGDEVIPIRLVGSTAPRRLVW